LYSYDTTTARPASALAARIMHKSIPMRISPKRSAVWLDPNSTGKPATHLAKGAGKTPRCVSTPFPQRQCKSSGAIRYDESGPHNPDVTIAEYFGVKEGGSTYSRITEDLKEFRLRVAARRVRANMYGYRTLPASLEDEIAK
jgi:hypothetical protein